MGVYEESVHGPGFNKPSGEPFAVDVSWVSVWEGDFDLQPVTCPGTSIDALVRSLNNNDRPSALTESLDRASILLR